MQELMGWRWKIIFKKMECLNRLYVKGLFLLRLNVLWKWMSWLMRNAYPPWYSKPKPCWSSKWYTVRDARVVATKMKVWMKIGAWTVLLGSDCIYFTWVYYRNGYCAWGMFPVSSITKQKTCQAMPQAILIDCSKWEPIRLPESTQIVAFFCGAQTGT